MFITQFNILHLGWAASWVCDFRESHHSEQARQVCWPPSSNSQLRLNTPCHSPSFYQLKCKSLQPQSRLPPLLFCTSHKALCVLPPPTPCHNYPLDMLYSVTSKCSYITNLYAKLSHNHLLLTLLSFQTFAIKVFFKNKLAKKWMLPLCSPFILPGNCFLSYFLKSQLFGNSCYLGCCVHSSHLMNSYLLALNHPKLWHSVYPKLFQHSVASTSTQTNHPSPSSLGFLNTSPPFHIKYHSQDHNSNFDTTHSCCFFKITNLRFLLLDPNFSSCLTTTVTFFNLIKPSSANPLLHQSSFLYDIL